jgi:hypothetical protein
MNYYKSLNIRYTLVISVPIPGHLYFIAEKLN